MQSVVADLLDIRFLFAVVATLTGPGPLFGVAFGTVLALTAVTQWQVTTWSFDGAALVHRYGVWNKTERRVPVARIQHIESDRRLRHLLLGLAIVRVEVSGSGDESEVTLDAVTLAEAAALAVALEAARQPSPGSPPSEDTAWPSSSPAHSLQPSPAPDGRLRPQGQPPVPNDGPGGALELAVSLRPARLAIAGVTGAELLVVFGVIGTALNRLDDLGVDPTRVDAPVLGPVAIVVSATVGVVAWFAIAAGAAVLRYWDLRVVVSRPDGDPAGPARLVVRYGLLQRTDLRMDLDRVRSIRLRRSVLRRLSGYTDVEVQSIGGGSGRGTVRAPMLDEAEVARLLAVVMPTLDQEVPLVPTPARARRRLLVRNVVGVGAVGIVVAVVAWSASPALGIAAVVAAPVLGGVRGECAHRTLGSVHDGTHVRSRTGAFASEERIAPRTRFQSAATRASFFQRRRRLATVRIDIAGPGGPVVAPERGNSEADALLAALGR